MDTDRYPIECLWDLIWTLFGKQISPVQGLIVKYYWTGATGFEPAISTLTGWHVKPLHHAPIEQDA